MASITQIWFAVTCRSLVGPYNALVSCTMVSHSGGLSTLRYFSGVLPPPPPPLLRKQALPSCFPARLNLKYYSRCPLQTDAYPLPLKFWFAFGNNKCDHSVSSNRTAWIETDGNNRQLWARGLCSIDPIALIKVVYRENTMPSDGWLLVIMQQPANITAHLWCADSRRKNQFSLQIKKQTNKYIPDAS